MQFLIPILMILFFIVSAVRASKQQNKKAANKRGSTASTASPKKEPFVQAAPSPSTASVSGEGSAGVGSMAYHSPEGKDPCHTAVANDPLPEINLISVKDIEEEPARVRLSFGKDEIENGFIMSEILNRKAPHAHPVQRQ